jgi:hypothetical protein
MEAEIKKKFPEAKITSASHSIHLSWSAAHLVHKDVMKVFSEVETFAHDKFHITCAFLRLGPPSLEVYALVGAPVISRKRKREEEEEEEKNPKKLKTTADDDEKRAELVEQYAMTLAKEHANDYTFLRARTQADLGISLSAIQGLSTPADVQVEPLPTGQFKLTNYQLVNMEEMRSWVLDVKDRLAVGNIKFFIDENDHFLCEVQVA